MIKFKVNYCAGKRPSEDPFSVIFPWVFSSGLHKNKEPGEPNGVTTIAGLPGPIFSGQIAESGEPCGVKFTCGNWLC